MKQNIINFVIMAIVLGLIFIVVLWKYENLSVIDGAFWFSIILLLLAFFTKKDSSVLPFGSIKGLGTKNNGMDMTLGNEYILSKGHIQRNRISNEYNGKNSPNNLCLYFFIFGIIFGIISLIFIFI